MERLVQDISKENHLGTQYKKLNQRIKELKHEEINKILPLLQNEDNIHRYIKLYIIDHFKLYDELIDLFKSEDKQLICKALKCKWFFEGSNKDIISIDYFEKNLFPFISYTTKVKILHNLCLFLKDESRIEVFFIKINEKYTFDQSSRLLAGCSIDFIKNILKEIKKDISPKILLDLAKKDFNLPIFYFRLFAENKKANNKKVNFADYNYVLNYIASKNLKIWLDFYKDYSDIGYYKMNRKTTKTVLTCHASLVIANAKNFIRVIHEKYFGLYLNKEDLISFIKQVLPKKLSDFHFHYNYNYYFSMIELLKPLSANDQYEIVLRIFKEVFNTDLLDCKDILPNEIIEKMPLEQRVKFIEKKTSKTSENKNIWIRFLPISESIPYIKKQLRIVDTKERAFLIESMVNTCFINDNMEEFTKVCEFFQQRYRNDHIDVKNSYFSAIKNKLSLKKIDINQFELIFKFIKIFQIKQNYEDTYSYHDIIREYLKLKITNNLPYDDLILNIIKYITHEKYNYTSWNLFEDNSNYNYICMKAIVSHLKENPKKDYWEQEDNLLNFLQAIKTTNNKFPSKRIRITNMPWLVEKYTSYLDDHINKNMVNSLDFSAVDNKTREIIIEKIFNKEPFQFVLIHYLKKDPQKILNNLDKIIEHILKQNVKKYIKFFRMLKATGFLNIYNILFEKCFDLLSTDIDVEEKARAIKIICLLCDPNKLENIIEPYYPIESTLSEDDADIYCLRRAFIKTLFRIQPIIDYKIISKFLVKDYLNLALGSLYSICLNSSEIKVKSFLNENLSTRVSLKKHSIILLYLLGTKSEIYDMLNVLLKKEKNPSLRKIIFKMVLNIFCTDPTQENYTLLLSILNQINKSDSDNIEIFFHLFEIPKSYLNDYCPKIWAILNMEFEPNDVEKKNKIKIKFFDIISKEVYFNKMEPNFVYTIINDHLDIELKEIFPKILSLAIMFLLQSRDENMVKILINKLFSYFKNFITPNYTKEFNKDHFKYQKSLLEFIENLCSKTLKLISDDKITINNYIFAIIRDTLYDETYPDLYFKERVYLHLLTMYIEDKDLVILGQKSVNIFTQMIEKFSNFILLICPNIIHSFLKWIPHPEDEKDEDNKKYEMITRKILFSYGLIQNSIACQILTTQILPQKITENHSYYPKYLEIIEKIKSTPEVKPFVNNLLMVTSITKI